MKDKNNLGNINEEVKTTPTSEFTEEKKTDDISFTDSEEVTSTETDFVDGSVTDENTDEEQTEEVSTDDDSDEESADENEDEDEEVVTVVADKNKGMKMREKIILAVTGIALLLLLLWLIFSLIGDFYRNDYMRPDEGNNTLQTDTSNTTDDGSLDVNVDINGDKDSDGTTDDTDASDKDNDSDDDSSSDMDQTDKDDGSDGSNKGDETTDNGDDSSDPDDTDNGNGTDSDDGKKDDETSKPNGDGDNSGDNDKDDDQTNNDGDNTASDYTGEVKVRISTVNDDTGIITITIDGASIVVPVQTTVFNGRVTKSGVAQGQLFGYNSGITVMLYYPREQGFDTDSVNGYMNRSGKSLTVLVDINGDGSKLMIKVNGMKSLM